MPAMDTGMSLPIIMGKDTKRSIMWIEVTRLPVITEVISNSIPVLSGKYDRTFTWEVYLISTIRKHPI